MTSRYLHTHRTPFRSYQPVSVGERNTKRERKKQEKCKGKKKTKERFREYEK
jgi:hypothetical protein